MKNKLGFKSLLFVLAVSGLVLGATFSQSSSSEGLRYSQDTALESWKPESIGDLVGRADLIVEGTVVAVVDKGTFYGYDAGASRRAEMDKASLTPLSVPFVDYEVRIEQTIMDSGLLGEKKRVILRLIENPDVSTSKAMLGVGARRLFFLNINPDGKSYGISSLLSQIDLSGPEAQYYKGSDSLAPFGIEISSEEFMEQTKQVAKNWRN